MWRTHLAQFLGSWEVGEVWTVPFTRMDYGKTEGARGSENLLEGGHDVADCGMDGRITALAVRKSVLWIVSAVERKLSIHCTETICVHEVTLHINDDERCGCRWDCEGVWARIGEGKFSGGCHCVCFLLATSEDLVMEGIEHWAYALLLIPIWQEKRAGDINRNSFTVRLNSKSSTSNNNKYREARPRLQVLRGKENAIM
jgi:hypothetical protein